MPGLVMHGICKYTLTNLLCNCTTIRYNVWHQQLADWLWRTSTLLQLYLCRSSSSTSCPYFPITQGGANSALVRLISKHQKWAKNAIHTSAKINPLIWKRKKLSALKLTCHLNFYILQKEYGNLEDITRVKLTDSDIWVLPEFPPTKWWLVVV